MFCPDDGLVFVATAAFGRYDFCPSGQCCEPDTDDDCVEELLEDHEDEWTNLKLACNYQNNCGYQHNPRVMTSACSNGELADYLTVTYVCSNGKKICVFGAG